MAIEIQNDGTPKNREHCASTRKSGQRTCGVFTEYAQAELKRRQIDRAANATKKGSLGPLGNSVDERA